MTTSAYQAAKIIQEKAPHFKPKLGVVLGSGLGRLANYLTEKMCIDYDELPGFPHVTVYGHKGQLVLGLLNEVPILCLQGRAHPYEGPHTAEVVKTYIRTLRLLGCEYLIATNAAGSLDLSAPPGSLMLITDHINWQPTNPLVGPNEDDFGPRFFPVDEAYSPILRSHLLNIAQAENITLHQGVYIAVLGPNYETAAEIRAFQLLGANVVGMSTVPEVLVAQHCGLKTAVISTITNFATGLNVTPHSHQAVVEMANLAADQLIILIQKLVAYL